MNERVEVISRVERRRRWSTEDKMRILEEAMQPGASVAAIADREGISRGLVFEWRRNALAGRIAGLVPAGFAQVQVRAEQPVAVPFSPAKAVSMNAPASALVEIILTNGRVLRVDASIETSVLKRLIAVVEGR